MAENVPENLKTIFSQDCRQALTEMIEAQGSSDAILSSKKKKNLALAMQADSPIKFSQLSKANDLASAGDIFELGKFCVKDQVSSLTAWYKKVNQYPSISL